MKAGGLDAEDERTLSPGPRLTRRGEPRHETAAGVQAAGAVRWTRCRTDRRPGLTKPFARLVRTDPARRVATDRRCDRPWVGTDGGSSAILNGCSMVLGSRFTRPSTDQECCWCPDQHRHD